MSCTAGFTESQGARIGRWAAAAVLAFGLHAGGATVALMHWQQDTEAVAVAGAISLELPPRFAAAPMDTPDVAPGPLMQEAILTPQASKQTKQEVDRATPRVEPSPLARQPEVAVPIVKPVQEQKRDEETIREDIPAAQDPNQSSAPLTTAPPRIATTPSTAALARSPGSATSPANMQITWTKALVAHLNRFKRYPDAARARGVQGEVSVTFTIDRTGQVVASHVVHSSGSTTLDEEALAVLHRASPLPSPPAQLAGAMLNLTIPIQFKIR
jgi:periplasmic protein TonB